ncbi:MAG: hypothetical protein HYY38_00160 [Rhodospirillales bacterium]|nr:hypothetical protein [Rhodospirillales bacterium]
MTPRSDKRHGSIRAGQGAGARTVAVVTHNPELAAHTDRRIRIVDGRIVEDTGIGA